MEFSELIKARKSIRGFQNKPIPRELIDEIIEVAKWAPSSMNTQPWYVHVVTQAPRQVLTCKPKQPRLLIFSSPSNPRQSLC